MKDLGKIIYGLGFELVLKIHNNDRALLRVNAGAGAVANDGNLDIRDISWCVPGIETSNDNRIIVQKGLSDNKNIEFRYFERRNFISMYPMLPSSYLIWVLKVLWKDHNL